MSVTIASCATFRRAPPAPPAPPPASAPTAWPPAASIVGIASWYGPGFDGHPTASGEIYDQHDLTAASTVIPIGSRVLVTNLSNDRSVEVTINDHGPFVKGRTLDLSQQAARMIGLIKEGTAEVRMDVLSKPEGSREVGTAPRYFVQVGSFVNSTNAERVRDAVARRFSDVCIATGDSGGQQIYRVRMGAFATRADAQRRATAAAGMGFQTVLVAE
ncbi:MAG: septal ring lytic transglycosylase RlpA family protein [Candidatus Binataceae bacterium]